MGPALIGLLTALPELIKMINSFAAWIQKISGNDPAGFAVKAGSAFSQLANSKTPEEHSASAKALADLLANMPTK